MNEDDLRITATMTMIHSTGELKGVMHGWLWKRNKEAHCDASGDR